MTDSGGYTELSTHGRWRTTPQQYADEINLCMPEVLQLCRFPVVGWPDASPGFFGLILLSVGWHLRFSLSYWDVEKLLDERGLRADHVIV
jgi:hypothetical protein